MGFLAKHIGHRHILSPLRISHTRRQSLVDLLAYANANVPFYEGRYTDFLKECDRLDDTEFYRAFAETPITTKQDLKNHNDAFKSRTLASKLDITDHGSNIHPVQMLWSLFIRKNFKVSISTGGSSGMPTYRWLDYDDANVMAQSFLESFSRNGWSRGEPFVVYYPLKSYFTDTYATFNSWLHRLFGFSVVPFETVDKQSVVALLETLKRQKATLLVIFPCVLQRVAEIMYRENIPPCETLKYINVSGEFFFDCSKAFIQTMFPNARIEMTYGSVELGELAHQHGQSSFDYEIFNEFSYVEESQNDSLIITSLHQKAFPMIRYEMEDKAQVVNNANGTQYLMCLEGKNTDFLQINDGEKYYASFFNCCVNAMNEECGGNIIHFMMRYQGNSAQMNFVLKERNGSHEEYINAQTRQIMAETFPHFTDVTISFPAHFDHDYTRKFKIIGQGDGLAEVVGGYYKRKAG